MKKYWMKYLMVVTGAVFSLVLFPKFAAAATLFLSPGSANVSVGSSFSVNVVTNTQGAAVNTAEAAISFTSNTLQLVSVKQGSTFYLASPGSPTKGTGTAHFGGGLPTPGYTGANGILGSMTFRAIAQGPASITIDSGKVLLNDGLGTDALTARAGSTVTVAPPPVGAVAVSSSTHPNPESWYKQSDVALSWNRPASVFGFSFELDQKSDTVPDSTLDTTTTTVKTYPGLKDGVWYFHIRGRAENASAGFGTTTHFKIQIDHEAPLPFEVALSDLTLNFETTDSISGIDRYEVSSNGKVIEPAAGSPYVLNNLKSGTNQITVTAFDRAGNNVKAEITVTIKGLGFFNKTLQVPLYLVLLLILLILGLFSALIVLVLKKNSHRVGSLEEIAKLERQLKVLNKEVGKTKTKIVEKIKKIKKEGGLRE